MTEQQIEQAYLIADDYINNHQDDWTTEDIVQIAIQLCLNGEVFYNSDGTVQRID